MHACSGSAEAEMKNAGIAALYSKRACLKADLRQALSGYAFLYITLLLSAMPAGSKETANKPKRSSLRFSKAS